MVTKSIVKVARYQRKFDTIVFFGMGKNERPVHADRLYVDTKAESARLRCVCKATVCVQALQLMIQAQWEGGALVSWVQELGPG